jgi:hypothetical protein
MSEWLYTVFLKKQYLTIADIFFIHYGDDGRFITPQQHMQGFQQRWGNFDPIACRKLITANVNEDDHCIAMWLLAFQQAYEIPELVPFLTSSSVKERWTSALILGERGDNLALPGLYTMLTEFLPFYNHLESNLAYWIECRRGWVPNVLRYWRQPETTDQLRTALETCLSYHSLEHINKDELHRYEDTLAYELGYRDWAGVFVGIKATTIELSIAMLQLAMGVYASCHGKLSRSYLNMALRAHEQWLISRLQKQLSDTFALSEQETLRILNDYYEAQMKGRDNTEWVEEDEQNDNEILYEIPPFSQKWIESNAEMQDEVLELYQSLTPSKYVVLDEVTIRQDTPVEGLKSYVTIELKLSSQGAEDGILHLHFYDVVDLRVNLPSGYNQIGYIKIVSIREQQWEHLNYRVDGTENNALSFYCSHFTKWSEPVLPPKE